MRGGVRLASLRSIRVRHSQDRAHQEQEGGTDEQTNPAGHCRLHHRVSAT